MYKETRSCVFGDKFFARIRLEILRLFRIKENLCVSSNMILYVAYPFKKLLSKKSSYASITLRNQHEDTGEFR